VLADQQGEPAPIAQGEDEGAPLRSLLGDVEALIDDARTFFDAELNFQKSRAGYVAGRIKLAIVLGLGALFFAVMALFGLTVGLIIALTPLLTAWGATGAVVGALLLGTAIMALKLLGVWKGMMAEIRQGPDSRTPHG